MSKDQVRPLKWVKHLRFECGCFRNAVQTRRAVPPQGGFEPTVIVTAADTNVWLLYSCSKRATPKLSFAKASWRRITHSLQWISWVRLKLLPLAQPRKEMRA
jgi:hypothetical protein